MQGKRLTHFATTPGPLVLLLEKCQVRKGHSIKKCLPNKEGREGMMLT